LDFFFVATTVIFYFHGFAMADEWKYEALEKWPGFCVNKSLLQSPIHIKSDSLQCNSTHGIEFGSGFDQETPFSVINTGHSVHFEVSPDSKDMTIIRKSTKEVYKVDHVDVHFGGIQAVLQNIGSEHRIDSEPTVLEIHIFAHHSKFINSTMPKTQLGDVLATSMLYRLGQTSIPALEKVVSVIDQVRELQSKTKVNLRISDILPATRSFFMYPGSYTSPDCDPIVSWYVFKEVQTVTMQQMERLQKVKGENYDSKYGNFRPIQPLHGRKVTCNP
jgi:carbonic anhydrase